MSVVTQQWTNNLTHSSVSQWYSFQEQIKRLLSAWETWSCPRPSYCYKSAQYEETCMSWCMIWIPWDSILHREEGTWKGKAMIMQKQQESQSMILGHSHAHHYSQDSSMDQDSHRDGWILKKLPTWWSLVHLSELELSVEVTIDQTTCNLCHGWQKTKRMNVFFVSS